MRSFEKCESQLHRLKAIIVILGSVSLYNVAQVRVHMRVSTLEVGTSYGVGPR